MSRHTPPGVVAALLLVALTTSGASARSDPQKGSKPADLVFGAGVSVIAVPVFVTDKQGRAIPGLTADDFEIEDQGKKVPVVGFAAVDAGAPEAGQLGGSAPALQAARARQFLLLFDLNFSNSSGILKARAAALDFLERALFPTDLVAAATFSGAGARVLVGFTPDREQVARAIETLGATEGQRRSDPLGLAYDLGADVQRTAMGRVFDDPDTRDQVLAMERAEGEQYRRQVQNFISGLDQLGRLLDSVRGRKQVILLSAGFDPSVLGGAQGTGAVEAAQAVTEGRLWEVQSDDYFGDAGARRQMDKLYDTLALSDTVIHTVDVGGLTTDVDVQQAVSTSRSSGRESLSQIARGSGGQFVRETNDLAGALAEALQASRYYYVLAFEPAGSARPGKVRKLKIRVKRDGTEVSHRAGYLPPDPKQVADAGSRRLDAAETIAKGITGGAFELRAVAVPYRSAVGAPLMAVVLEADGPGLLGKSRDSEMKLEVYAYALDGSGRIRDALGLTPTLDLTKLGDSIRDKGFQVVTTFEVVQGPVDLRFLVRDANSERGASMQIHVDMPSFSGGDIVMSPPLFMDDPRARVVVPAASRALRRLDLPFHLDDAPFTPDLQPVLDRGQRQKFCVIAYGVRGGVPTVTAELVSDAGEATAVAVEETRLVEAPDGFQRVVADLSAEGAPKGDYTLRVTLSDAGSGSTGTSEQAVRIR